MKPPPSLVSRVRALGEPSSARWQVGLGWSLAWTSDVKNLWAVEWVRWPGFGQFWGQLVREHMRSKKRQVYDMRAEIDPEDQGGAYLLGLRRLGVIAHGRFSRRGFARAIEVAARGVQEDVIERTREALREAGALRPPAHPGEAEGGQGAAGQAPSETAATVSKR